VQTVNAPRAKRAIAEDLLVLLPARRAPALFGRLFAITRPSHGTRRRTQEKD